MWFHLVIRPPECGEWAASPGGAAEKGLKRWDPAVSPGCPSSFTPGGFPPGGGRKRPGPGMPWGWLGAPGTPLSSSEQAHEDSRPFTDQRPPEHTDTRATESPWTAPREPTPASPAHIPTIAHLLLTPARRPARTPPCQDPRLKQGAHRAPATRGALPRRRSRGALPPHTRLLCARRCTRHLWRQWGGGPGAVQCTTRTATRDSPCRSSRPTRRFCPQTSASPWSSQECTRAHTLLPAPQGWEVPSDPRLVCTGLQDKERPTWPPHLRAWEGKGWRMA